MELFKAFLKLVAWYIGVALAMGVFVGVFLMVLRFFWHLGTLIGA